MTSLLADWSVEKVERMGAAAAKLLLYYRSDLQENGARQRDLVCRVGEDSAHADLPFLLEAVTYPIAPSESDPATFAMRKPDLVVQAARDLTPWEWTCSKPNSPPACAMKRTKGKCGRPARSWTRLLKRRGSS